MKTRKKGEREYSTAEKALEEKFKIIKQRKALQVRFSVSMPNGVTHVLFDTIDAAVADDIPHRYAALFV